MSGATIEIQERARRGRRALGGAVTGVDGSWSAAVALSRRATVRAAARGDAHHRAVLSRDVEILPSAAIRLQATVVSGAAASPGRGATSAMASIAVSGTIAPAQGRVTLSLFALDASGTPAAVLRRRVPVSGGAFSVILTVPGPGRYRVIARSVADPSNAAGISPPADVVVS